MYFKINTNIYMENIASSFWLSNHEFLNSTNKHINYMALASTQRAISNFISIVTGRKIPVKYQTHGTSFTDGEVVTIGSTISQSNIDSVVGLALHEASHILLTDFSLIKGYQQLGSLFRKHVAFNGCDNDMNISSQHLRYIKDLLNWVEDRRIDYYIYQSAPGYRPYYEAMYDEYFKAPIITDALICNNNVNECWDDYMFHIINLTNSHRNLNALNGLSEIWNIIDLRRIDRLHSTNHSMQLACDIFKIIKKYVNEPTLGSSNNKYKFNKRKLNQLHDAVSRQTNFLDNQVYKSGKLKLDDQLIVNSLQQAGTEEIQVNVGTQQSPCIVNCYIINKLTHDVIRNFTDIFSNKSMISPDVVKSGLTLGIKLGNKLQIRNKYKTLKTTRQKSGQIDKRLICNIVHNDSSIFYKTSDDVFKNFFIHISIDASTSMDEDDKFKQSIISAIAIAKAASMTTGVRVQISLRGTYEFDNNIRTPLIIYAYDSKYDSISKIKTFFIYLKTFGFTPEGIAHRAIIKNLKRDANQGVSESIFINYSDGMPGGVDNLPELFDGIEYTKDSINIIKSNNINVLSYFLESHDNFTSKSNFKRMYGKFAEFIDATSLIKITNSLNNKFTELQIN